MATRDTRPLSEERFQRLTERLDRASQRLSERERAFVIEAFKEGMATADRGEVQGYAQIVDATTGGITPIAEPLNLDERRALRQKLSQIGEHLTPGERAFVQTVFVRGALSLDEVQGYGLYYSFTQQGVVTGYTVGSGGVGVSIDPLPGDPTTSQGAQADAGYYLAFNQAIPAVLAY